MDNDGIRKQIEALRHKLLDLTMRNRMLNYRPSKRLGITVTGEDSFEVYRMLVDEGKKMTFVGRPDPKSEPLPGIVDYGESEVDDTAPATEDDTPFQVAEKHDLKLSTDEMVHLLPAKLRVIQREATLANDELGINTLFLTLGTLQWQETDQRSFRAPLLYVPVALERQANGAVRLIHDGSDVGDNLPLRAKLQEFNLKLPEHGEDGSLPSYFEQVASTIDSRDDWTVHPHEICLGFFNYEKYAMYMDLGGDGWPEGRKPWSASDIVAMLGGGYTSPDSPIGDHTWIDDVRPARDGAEVYDADSSQTIALIRAAAGLSIVVEGPPGTGKSQTITNVIAEAVAEGKTVLFVAAKRAAVDVVKRKLADADLGRMCLDLHDKLTNRREFYAEIKSTLNRTLHVRQEDAKVERLQELRDALNAHSRAINEKLPELGDSLSPFFAMSQLARLPKETPEDVPGRVAFELLQNLKHEQILRAMPSLRVLQARIRNTGVPVGSPFWGAEIEYLDPGLRLDLDTNIASALEALASARDELSKAASAFHLEVPSTLEDVRVLRICVERAVEAPAHDGVAVNTGTWKSAEPDVRRALDALRTRNAIREARMAQVTENAWNADLALARTTYEHLADRWYRSLSGAFRSARKVVREIVTESGPSDSVGQLALLRDLNTVRVAEADVAAAKEIMARLFGVQWQGFNTDTDVIDRLLKWVLDLYSSVQAGGLPAGLLEFFQGAHDSADSIALAEAAERSSYAAIEAYLTVARALKFPDISATQKPWPDLVARLEEWRTSLPDLPEYIRLNEARHQVAVMGLESVVQIADRWELAHERLLDAFLRSYYSGVLRYAMGSRPELRNFDRKQQEQFIAEFRNLDDFKLKYNRACVRAAHHRRLPSFDLAVGNLQLLKVQCELQRRHKPIRWIMARAGEAIQRAKPVFMMSPLSVAIHLPPELPPFDMVIFDEASQVKPEDALCSIIRANQTIVVGDTRQMPPTSFFDRVSDDEDYDEEADESMELGQEARKLESVLSLMSAVTMGSVRRPDLRWHYRSIHPSLIQPSNEMFYENRLIVFPSPSSVSDGRRIGVLFHHDPDSVYESGAQRRINRKEAEAVARAVCAHVRDCPRESLMIAAMNKPQADLIDDEVMKQERADPVAFQRFRELHPHEPLAVKNLENVQGDERDVVFISVTYGRDQFGVIHQRFGPLQRDGGERRLNVLITRARRRCEVFSNITADDLRSEIPRIGVTALKRYLSYAQTGNMDISSPTGEPEESPFEEEVSFALRKRGYDVATQVGCEGYRIDLAVRDPESPGRFLLGIECDGASYHSAKSARDRDKLRQRILEDRGWSLHRIWSPDWWQDRDGEVRRLVAAVEESRGAAPPDTPLQGESEPESLVTEAPRQSAAPITRPYLTAAQPGYVPDEQAVVEYLVAVVEAEGPIHHQLLINRLRIVTGYGHAGVHVRGWFERLISATIHSGRVMATADAYYSFQAQLDQPRDWSSQPATEKKSQFVPEVEIAMTLRYVVSSAFGVSTDEAIDKAFKVLGFSRTSKDALERGRPVLQALLDVGALVEKNGLLYLP